MKAKETDILKAVLEEIEAQGYIITAVENEMGTFTVYFKKEPDNEDNICVYEKDLESLRKITVQIERQGCKVRKAACDVLCVATKLSIEFAIFSRAKINQ